MKKGLLIWNVVVTVVALIAIFGACTSDSMVDWCVDKIQTQQLTITQLQSDVSALQSANNQFVVLIQNHENSIASLQNTLNQIVAYMNAQ